VQPPFCRGTGSPAGPPHCEAWPSECVQSVITAVEGGAGTVCRKELSVCCKLGGEMGA
jgi:hypothetical protein